MKKVYILILTALVAAAGASGCGAKEGGDSSAASSKAETTAQTSAVSTAAEEGSSPEESSASETEISESIHDLFLVPDHNTVRIGEDSNEVIFVARDIPIDAEVELVDGDTGEVVGKMLDDADLENSGDEIKGDGWYSLRYKVDIDFPSDPDVSEDRRYHYHARYVDDTIEHRSDDVEIFVYESFTEKELDTMETVDNAVHELMQSDGYKAMGDEEKRDELIALLTSLQEEGLIDKDGINEDGDFISYSINGLPTFIMLKDFDPMMN